MKEARIEIIKGNEAGAQFKITGDKVRIGRAPDSDIIITDASASRNHAELVKVNNSFLIRDLNSSNGVFVNGTKVKEQYLVSKDVFSIGNHEYRYWEKEVSAAEINKSAQVAQRDGTIPGINPSSADLNIPSFASSSGAKKKRLILYGVVFAFLLGFIFLLGSEDASDESKKEDKKTDQKLLEENILIDSEQEEKIKTAIPEEDRVMFEKANEHYFQGQRELRLRNYSRALEEFRKALSFYPQHIKARTASNQTSKKIEEESNTYLAIGKKMFVQGRFEDAIRHFNAVINLNVRQPNSDMFKEAEKWKNMAEKRRGETFE